MNKKVLALLFISATSFAQTKPEAKPLDTLPILTTEQKLAMQDVQLAIQAYQLAQMQYEAQVARQLEPLKADAEKKIAVARAVRNLPGDWNYSPEVKDFVKPGTPAPAPTPAATAPPQPKK